MPSSLRLRQSPGHELCDLLDRQLVTAANHIAEQNPEMCAIVGPRDYRDNAAVLSQKLPADQVDAAVAAFSSATGGNPVGKYVGSDDGSGHAVSADDPGAQTDEFMQALIASARRTA